MLGAWKDKLEEYTITLKKYTETMLDYQRHVSQEEKTIEEVRIASRYRTKIFGTSLQEDDMTFHAKKARCKHFLKTPSSAGGWYNQICLCRCSSEGSKDATEYAFSRKIQEYIEDDSAQCYGMKGLILKPLLNLIRQHQRGRLKEDWQRMQKMKMVEVVRKQHPVLHSL